MQKSIFRVLASVVLLVGTTAFANALTAEPRKGVARIKVQPEMVKALGVQPMKATRGVLSTPYSSLNASLAQIKVKSIRPVFPYSEKFAEQRAKYGLDQWYEVTFDESVTPQEAQLVLSRTAGVQKANYKVPMRITEGDGEFRVLPKNAATPKTASVMPFNDPRLSMQWHYHNDGSLAQSRAGADVNLFEAWKQTTGTSDVLVAIIDGGVDYTHEDLAANMYVNTAELNGTAGVDDDGNGYIDDIYGYNFCTNSGLVYPHQHGTHVAGTVAAVNNNGIGVAGVAGGDGTPGSGVRMISCQVFDSRSGINNEGDFAAALVYAAEKGASIAQCSWGWGSPDYYEQDVLDAVKYFTEMARSDKLTGGLCIFASGNNGETGNFYPGCMPEVLTVGAMTAQLTPASYSNYGPWVDVVAPGGLMDFDQAQGVLSTLPDNNYGFNEGTSMATPHVSGIAALVLSKYGRSGMPASTLRQQIETSVNDFYALNPGYEGQFGYGYVDAAKALQMGDGSAPEAVGDFTLYPAQDLISVKWVIPASSDSNVNHHVVYYSTTQFDPAGDLSGVAQVVVDTKFAQSGEEFIYDLEGLDALTTYYIAIKAVDRWGNASAISAVKSATTNAGPKMTVDTSSLSISDEAGSLTGASFGIGNEAEGLLKWSARAATRSAAMSSRSVQRTMQRTAAYAGHLGIEPKAATKLIKTDEFVTDDYPQEICYADEIYAFIGDTDRSLPNSMAQNFTVDASQYPEGFNLTAVKATGANGENPTIQIYSGSGMIDPSNLLMEFVPQWFTYGSSLALPEQIFFEPGESFWVVFHFAPQQTLYPLSLGVTGDNAPVSASTSLMSNDLGNTWTRLSDALRGSSYETVASKATWHITAMSQNPDWSKILVLDPASGQVANGDVQTVNVTTDGQKLCNGTYNFNVFIDTNESGSPKHTLPVTLNVSGHKPEVTVTRPVDFGSLLVGQSKTVTIEVFNKGYGAFAGSQWSPGVYDDNISSTNPNFAGPSYLPSGLPARTTTQMEVTFTPTEAGSHSGQIVLTDKDGYQFKIAVQGVATDPAKIAFDPETVEVGDLEVGGDDVETGFTITNVGKYPMQFVMSKFSDEQIEGAAKSDVNKFGYSWTSNVDGAEGIAYDGKPELVGATDITSVFTDNNVWSGEIRLGFRFPYYGKYYESVYVTSFGGVGVQPYTDGNMFSPLTPGSYGVNESGLISVYGSQLRMAPDSKVEYAKQDGKLIINFSNVMAVVYDTDYTPISFHMTLSPNGDVEVFYDDYDGSMVFGDGRNIFIGVNDLEGNDPMTVTSAEHALDPYTGEGSTFYQGIGTGTAIRISAPTPDMIKSIEPASGLLIPGESVEVKAIVAATDEMNAGVNTTNLVVLSNDPSRPVATVSFNANITGASLVPELKLESDKVDFGDVFRTSVARRQLTVNNAGKSDMTVTGVTTANGRVTCTIDMPVVIAAGRSKDIVITVPTDTEGAVEDLVTVTADCGTATASVNATVIGCPEIATGYSSIEVTMPAGESEAKPLTITNNGNEDLKYSVLAGAHLSYTAEIGADSSVGYAYTSSVDDKSVQFDWVDIETTGLGEQNNFTYYMSHDFVAVDLPFEFPFYGEKYTRMYIYNTGFVSFTERNDDKIWPEPPATFPKETVFTNLIAPYWGMHSMDQTKTAGTFHYVTEDRAVISFMEYGNSMNIGVCYQLIMNADGTFKFQYKAFNENAVIFAPFGLAGISNIDGSEGIRLPERYMVFNQAVDFKPVVEQTVAAGNSAVADIKVLGDALAGEYESSIVINTNVPGSEKIEIPVSITLTGEAAPKFSSDVTIEHTLGYRSTDYSDPLVQMGALYCGYIEVANEGSAPFTITGLVNGGPTIVDEWFGGEMPLFYIFGNLPEMDMWTGEPTGGSQWQMAEDYINYISPVTVGKNPVRFAVPMMESEASMTPGTYDVPVTFMISGVEGLESKTVTVKFVVTPAPVMGLDREEIRVSNVDDSHVGDEVLVISNNGEYKLDYTLRLDPTGKGESDEFEGDGGGIAPMTVKAKVLNSASKASDVAGSELVAMTSAIKPMDFGKSDNVLNLPAQETISYRNGLYHPVLPGASAAYNYGAGNKYSEYKAATGFVAPAEGFNVSHIYTGIKVGSLEDCDLTVEIIDGNTPDGTTVLGHGTLHIDEGDPSGDSHLYVVALDRPVYMSPDQEFYVVITYPAGEEYPALLIPKEEAVVSNRYMGYTEDFGWFDVATMFKDQVGSVGYLTACLETVEGSAWAKIDDDKLVGSIAPGESVEIPVHISAALAPMDRDNKSVVVIKSNDPYMPLVNFPVYLDKNVAPVITVPASVVSVSEGSVTNVEITVADDDADDFTVTITDNGQIASVASAVVADGGFATIGNDGQTVTVTGGEATITVALTADYGDAGSFNFTVDALDSRDHASSATVRYVVEHVNRAPVALATAPLTVAVGSMSDAIAFEAFFEDPDGDDLTYTMTISDPSVATAYTSATGAVFEGKKVGTAEAEITATDPSGASISNKLTIEVTEAAGIDAVTSDSVITGVYPNPVVETLYITSDISCDDVSVRMISSNGKIVADEKCDFVAGQASAINVAHLAAGSYVLHISADGEVITRMIIKQ